MWLRYDTVQTVQVLMNPFPVPFSSSSSFSSFVSFTRYSFSHDECEWATAQEQEHRACREAAALFDMSSFGKVTVSGSSAAAALAWVR